MYKIDNKNLRAKIKNLEQRLDFQRYNIKEKQKEKGRKKKTRIIKNKQTKNKKQTKKQTNKKPPTTIQRLYMVFALKKKKSLFKKNSNNRLQK